MITPGRRRWLLAVLAAAALRWYLVGRGALPPGRGLEDWVALRNLMAAVEPLAGLDAGALVPTVQRAVHVLVGIALVLLAVPWARGRLVVPLLLAASAPSIALVSERLGMSLAVVLGLAAAAAQRQALRQPNPRAGLAAGLLLILVMLADATAGLLTSLLLVLAWSFTVRGETEDRRARVLRAGLPPLIVAVVAVAGLVGSGGELLARLPRLPFAGGPLLVHWLRGESASTGGGLALLTVWLLLAGGVPAVARFRRRPAWALAAAIVLLLATFPLLGAEVLTRTVGLSLIALPMLVGWLLEELPLTPYRRWWGVTAVLVAVSAGLAAARPPRPAIGPGEQQDLRLMRQALSWPEKTLIVASADLLPAADWLLGCAVARPDEVTTAAWTRWWTVMYIVPSNPAYQGPRVPDDAELRYQGFSLRLVEVAFAPRSLPTGQGRVGEPAWPEPQPLR